MFPYPPFFKGARLNFAENVLYPPCLPSPDSLALVAATEQDREYVSWSVLRSRVARCAAAMIAAGVRSGDRLASVQANQTNAVVVLLSAASIGALWTGVSPDTGPHAILERLTQIEPVILFADAVVTYNAKIHDVTEKLRAVVGGLPRLAMAVVFDPPSGSALDVGPVGLDGRGCMYSDFVRKGDPDRQLHFAQLSPEHPLYILFSSGTTGKPKCIVHGAAGTLVQHKKEHMLHCDIRPAQTVFYYTTITWMMFHWLVSALASGATVVLYDGSPFIYRGSKSGDELAMPRLIDELGIAHFGTSAKYLSILEQKVVMPKETVAMRTLDAVYSTASPLAPSTFEYAYRAFGPDIRLSSITGGTDILSLFGAPSPMSAVYGGEVQVRGLGMAIEAWDANGEDVTGTGETGDLVCVRPFPCQPVMFWKDPDGMLYRKSYFERFPGIWHHGDFVRINPRTGGLIMLGRSDGTLKPCGIRFGSSEIYNVLLKNFPREVLDALCVGRRRAHDVDETVVLFLKMVPGHSCTEILLKAIQDRIRAELSPRHVPGIIDECPDIPMTANGKKVEVTVKLILSGIEVQPSTSVANPDCLVWYRQWAESH